MNYDTIIEDALNELNRIYKQNPNNFFNEHDFHHIFFNLVYPKLRELIHPEYPTLKRFDRKREKEEKEYINDKHSFEPEAKVKYDRGHYDFAVLKKEFYTCIVNTKEYTEQEKFERLSNKKVCINNKEPPFIEIALEFKYFIKNLTQEDIKNIQFDLFKLKNAIESEKQIYAIFCKDLSKTDTDFIKNIKDSNIIIYKYNEEGEIK